MLKKNRMAEKYWRTLAIMKYSLLIDNSLPVNFWAELMDTANYQRNWLPTAKRSCLHLEKSMGKD